MTLYGFVVPFDQLLLQSGLPGRQSLLMAAYVREVPGIVRVRASQVGIHFQRAEIERFGSLK